MTRQAWGILAAAAVALGLVWAGGSAVNSIDSVSRIAEAIAYAEGFYVPGSRPARNNNPGDLTYSFGFSTIGNDGPFPIFQTLADGWAALHLQISEMLDNTSRVFNSGMTIAEIGRAYAGGDPGGSWAANVAARLGVAIDTRINQI